MSSFVARERDGLLKLRDLEDLKSYCYAVAGIVGEMLTELFLLSSDTLRPIAGRMREEAASFGEALQLVNILKDRATDAGEGRHYLPEGLEPDEVFGLAQRDLAIASGYCSRLERAGGDPGIVAFTALPVLLARATLDTVHRLGAGAKISREEVQATVARLHEALERGAVSALMARGPEVKRDDNPPLAHGQPDSGAPQATLPGGARRAVPGDPPGDLRSNRA